MVRIFEVRPPHWRAPTAPRSVYAVRRGRAGARRLRCGPSSAHTELGVRVLRCRSTVRVLRTSAAAMASLSSPRRPGAGSRPPAATACPGRPSGRRRSRCRVAAGRRWSSDRRGGLAFGREELAQLGTVDRPGRLVLEDDVVVALQRHQPGALDAGGEVAGLLEVVHPVAARVEHQGRQVELAQQVRGCRPASRCRREVARGLGVGRRPAAARRARRAAPRWRPGSSST